MRESLALYEMLSVASKASLYLDVTTGTLERAQSTTASFVEAFCCSKATERKEGRRSNR